MQLSVLAVSSTAEESTTNAYPVTSDVTTKGIEYKIFLSIIERRKFEKIKQKIKTLHDASITITETFYYFIRKRKKGMFHVSEFHE